MNIKYSSAGVNISEGEKFVNSIKNLVKSTFSKNVLSGIGNFGSFYRIPLNYNQPVFVASTDGVGTKIKIAIETSKYDTIGEDIVNHCVNDIAVCGAVPLFFLDYLAFGKLSPKIAKEIVKGLVKGCKKNRCSLIGGETAEMPGVYSQKDFDLAGTIVGIVEQKKIINVKNVRPGDVLIGFPSTGLHTNGYSLARKILLKKYSPDKYIPELKNSLGNELLKVHKSYLDLIQRLTKKYKVHSFSHITGGGILGNTKRVVPNSLKINIDWNMWEKPAIFKLIQREGNITESEMRRVFNLGIGLIAIVSRKDVLKITSYLKKNNYKHYLIGNITKKYEIT